MATTRTRTAVSPEPPTRRRRPVSRTRSSFGCSSSGSSPISSSTRVPPDASSNQPARRVAAPVKAPRSCPKSSLSASSRGKRAAVHGHERARGRGPELVQRARQSSSLPVPLSPVTRTGIIVGATRAARASTARSEGSSPMMAARAAPRSELDMRSLSARGARGCASRLRFSLLGFFARGRPPRRRRPRPPAGRRRGRAAPAACPAGSTAGRRARRRQGRRLGRRRRGRRRRGRRRRIVDGRRRRGRRRGHGGRRARQRRRIGGRDAGPRAAPAGDRGRRERRRGRERDRRRAEPPGDAQAVRRRRGDGPTPPAICRIVCTVLADLRNASDSLKRR